MECRKTPEAMFYNPWNLTASEISAVEALIETGSITLAAEKMGLSPRTVEAHLGSIRVRMGCRTYRAVILWDRWARTA